MYQKSAINRARELYVHDKDKHTSFKVDDILNSKIKDKSFDYVFDTNRKEASLYQRNK